MIILNSDKIRDFQSCELLYKYRHIDNELEPVYSRQISLERFQEEMKKIFTFFFYKKQGSNTPSYTALINRWERCWFSEDTTAEDITNASLIPTTANETSLSNRAATILMNFHNDFDNINYQPIIIDETMQYSFNSEIQIDSHIDLALRNPEKKAILVIKWTFRERSKGLQDHGLYFAMIDYILKNKSSLSKDHDFVYATYEVSSKTNQLKTYKLEQKHINAMQFWLKKINETNIYGPRRGLSTACKSCNFDEACISFNEYFGEAVE